MQIFNCGLHYNASLVFLCNKNAHTSSYCLTVTPFFFPSCLPLIHRKIVATLEYLHKQVYIYIYMYTYFISISIYIYIHVYLSLGFCFASHLLFRECGRSNSKAEQDDGSIASTACGSQSTTPPCGSIDVAPCSMRT